MDVSERPRVFRGEFDDEGVYIYQAFNESIAKYAVEHQKFLGCPDFRPDRMTWIKPSFGWVLYRSGYGTKHNQTRVLKVKLSHEAMAHILERCKLTTHSLEKSVDFAETATESTAFGRVQWDPERDLLSVSETGREPRRMLRQRAIQIGVAHALSKYYVESVISIEDVTELSHRVREWHLRNYKKSPKNLVTWEEFEADLKLPDEKPYMPVCNIKTLKRLEMVE